MRYAITGVAVVILVGVGFSIPREGKDAAKEAGHAGTRAEEIAQTYKKLRLMTPQPVYVSAQLGALCAPATGPEASRALYGIHADAMVNIFMNDRAAAIFSSQKRDRY